MGTWMDEHFRAVCAIIYETTTASVDIWLFDLLSLNMEGDTD